MVEVRRPGRIIVGGELRHHGIDASDIFSGEGNGRARGGGGAVTGAAGPIESNPGPGVKGPAAQPTGHGIAKETSRISRSFRGFVPGRLPTHTLRNLYPSGGLVSARRTRDCRQVARRGARKHVVLRRDQRADPAGCTDGGEAGRRKEKKKKKKQTQDALFSGQDGRVEVTGRWLRVSNGRMPTGGPRGGKKRRSLHAESGLEDWGRFKSPGAPGASIIWDRRQHMGRGGAGNFEFQWESGHPILTAGEPAS